MFDPQMQLISTVLSGLVAEAARNPPNDAGWAEARRALQPTRDQEPEIARVVEARDLAALKAIVDQWQSGKRHLPEQDREVLKRAMKAFRKSLKVTRLSDESSVSGGPMSSGRQSNIVGMRPPDRYPREVWNELARQGRLIDAKHGQFELPPE